MPLTCPICGNELEYRNMRRLSNRKAKLIFFCSNCKTYYEIEVEFDEIDEFSEEILSSDDIEKMRLTINDLPENVPDPIRIIVSNKTKAYVPIYYRKMPADISYSTRDISPEYFMDMGIPPDLAKRLFNFFEKRGIKSLYSFQERAIRVGLSGKNMVITAPTGMGKTEAFLIPALARIAIERFSDPPHVLIIYPTKALARDQALKIEAYSEVFQHRFGIMDGDTPRNERFKIIKNPPEVILTNFDMIHYHLAKKTSVGNLFLRAKIIIIDELHEYYGAFGTHVHYIIKRLKRLSTSKKIQFIMASATIRNPKEFAEKFIEEPVIVISEKRRRVPLHIIFLYSFDAIQRSAALLAKEMIKNGIKSLVFFNTRKSAELTLHILNKISTQEPSIQKKYDIHRAGLPKKVRTSIEEAFRRGDKLVLIATPTLELGIDIGDVDLVVSEITPIDRFIQRSGRAGRRNRPGSAALLLRDDDPISDFYAFHPKEYFTDISLKYIEKRNIYIAKMHTYLAAFEKPLTSDDIKKQLFPSEIVETLLREGSLLKIGEKYYANGTAFNKYFSRNIRGSDKIIRVMYRGKSIDERDLHIAVRELYPGAIYINRGKKYISKKFDMDKLLAEVDIAPPEFFDLYTKPIYTSRASFLGTPVYRDLLGTRIFFGTMKMHEIVEGYVVYREGSKKPLAEYELDEPIHYEYITFGLAFKAPTANFGDPDKDGGAYHALEHILIEGTNAITGGGSEDLGGISFYPSGIIVIHDAIPGGNGVSQILYENFERAVKRALNILKSCRCPGDRESCNKCVYSYRCGNNNRPLYQQGALILLERMLRNEIVPDADVTPSLLSAMEKGIV